MRDFLKYTLASLTALVLFSGLSVVGLAFLLIAIVSSVDTGPQVKNKSVLTFDLSTSITDTGPVATRSEVLEEAFSDRPSTSLSLRAVLETLDRAAKDDRIVALYLFGNLESNGGTSFASLQEVRQALERFRGSGKKIIAYDTNWREREYYLGSVANTVILNPSGLMEMNGFRSENLFLAGALRKYGIDVQVTRVGKYKSAVEPFLQTKSSPENKEQTQKLLDTFWSEFQKHVAKSREIRPELIQKIADSKGILLPDEALKSRFIDQVAHLDEVVTDLKVLTGNKPKDKSFRQISLPTYAGAIGESLQKSSRSQIAVVYAEGEIVNGIGGVREVGGERFARQLRTLRLDDKVKAIVLRINSPGGSAQASDIIQREIILTSKVKPVIVSMGGVAASGGYWIATYATRIYAEPTTITGSIGVFGLFPNIQKIGNNNGLTWDTVKTGRYADMETLVRPKTPEELANYQRIVDKIYDDFIAKVAESRKLPRQKVAEIAQGRVWSGQTAKQLGLVDEIGGIKDAIQDAAKRANLGEDWQVVEYPKNRSLEERILQRLASDPNTESSPQHPPDFPTMTKLLSDRNDPMTLAVGRLWNELQVIRSLNDPTGVYMRMPYTIKID
ncbi:signal peptide peptidase SppA [Leptolyngbya sp. 'hensonii']|uniref:signal peptide peptidase SppA n=1 Tax=Leptolyngbya sp. 'hensonii' TaxID=1922337 RepID=UPI00094FD3B6|nr:signal peptide peptidase SppA [Leptolyngbya sp. 'hensonii']OLP17814.1 signal peptide peptidase SppA [Leptolyngbya sp. 'hensonii']